MDEHMGMLRTSVVILCLLLLTSLPQSHCAPNCKDLPYSCGTLSKIYGPFWGEDRPPECGRGDSFKLICHHDHDGNITSSIQIGSQYFTVKEINLDEHNMILVRADLERDVCSPEIYDTYNVNSSTLLRYDPSVHNITIFYNCSYYIAKFPEHFMCGKNHAIYYDLSAHELLKSDPWLFKECQRHVQVPADVVPERLDFLQEALRQGFGVNYNLLYQKSKVISRIVIVGVASALTAGFMICIFICFSKCKSSTQLKFWLRIRNDHDIEAFLKNHGALAQKRYKFSEVKKMTNSFKVKLGQGGFGAVYQGELPNGSTVAVKILNASKGNGEDFINEVASISRTSHVNIVALLGFCLEGHKKALIYEFMPNGSLDKFISNKGLKKTTEYLSWDNLWQISLGIARGLEYLHRGCNTRILHFDIKPHNILLGEDFCPKISDFGLAKLCPRKESIISMSEARGTIGYVAPEMWNRNFGGISHKSDVYSYGMMLLEIVGVRENINANSSHTSEIYFPDWIYKMLEQGEDLRTDGEIGTEENAIARRMTVVGLWCVQTFPKDRPAMNRVIEMLEGNMNSLEMPPKPVLSSPTRSLPEFSTISL